jgi:hypothetical protein
MNWNTVDTVLLCNNALLSYIPINGASISGNIFYSTNDMYSTGTLLIQ